MTLRWSANWTDNDNAEPNRYLDWNKVTGGIEPGWRDKARAALFFPKINSDRLRNVARGVAQASQSKRPPESDAPSPDTPPSTFEDHHKRLIDHLIAVILKNFRDPVNRLPPVPRNSITKCETNDPDTENTECYYHHILTKLALPEVLLPSASVASGKTTGNGARKKPDVPPELTVPHDTVIMGVLDVGIPLGHKSTRFSDGKTRILASWQQTAPRDPSWDDPDDKAQQFYIPFGREILAPEIDQALCANSGGDLRNGRLDEEAFNRDVYLEDYRSLLGQRDLGLRATHGAHVIGTAAGMDPEDKLAERARIIAVNMPDRSLVGHSAQFLEFFAVHGIIRVVMLADALWDKLYGHKKPKTRKGFPIVINLSFGKQASSRDSLDPITDMIETLNDERAAENRPPIILCMPAGNENLERGNIRTRLSAGAEVEFDWRLLPEDQSANFVEIWTGSQNSDPAKPSPLELQVVPPNGPASIWAGGAAGQVLNLVNTSADHIGASPEENPNLVARVYSDRYGTRSTLKKEMTTAVGKLDDLSAAKEDALEQPPDGQPTKHDQTERQSRPQKPKRERLNYLIAVKQTQLFETTALAPAGLWRIRLRNTTDRPMTLDISVQTDQSEEPRAAINQRSYFERPEYVRFDETGRVVDSYSYPLDKSRPRTTDVSNVLRRHGSINAVGHTPHSGLAAGHRASDGQMVPYSSTGHFRRRRSGKMDARDPDFDAHFPSQKIGRPEGAAPLLSLPIRDGAAHFGQLAAGGRDGAAVAMEGTSFACAQLSRQVLNAFLSDVKVDGKTVLPALRKRAATEDACQPFPGRVMPLKAGGGRMNSPRKSLVARRSEY